MPKIQAENSGGKLWRKFAVENYCGNTKFMRLTICDKTKADVEISAPLKLLRL
jgi:hypothetical protein